MLADDFERDLQEVSKPSGGRKRFCSTNDFEGLFIQLKYLSFIKTSTNGDAAHRKDLGYAVQLQQVPAPVVRPRIRRSLEEFPLIDQPLLARISLDKLCKEFPNHLVGKTIRRFVENDWTWNMTFCGMDPVAWKGLAKEKPWEVMEARFEEDGRGTGVKWFRTT
jgi:hypothetical protein